MDPDPLLASLAPMLASASDGLSALQVILLLVMPLLLVGSGFFSGSETALFGLSAGERLELRRQPGPGPRAVLVLLKNQRLLLIMLMLGNMTMNVLYFVISSVLMMHDLFGWFGDICFAIGALLGIVLLGELVPKFLASSHRIRFARLVSPLLLAIYRGLYPFWRTIDLVIVTPLSRLTSPSSEPPGLSSEELQALVELSGHEGVLDATEQRQLHDVLRLGRTKVHVAMTPRTRMASLALNADVEAVRELARETQHIRLLVHGESRDDIVGVLHVKDFLQRSVHETPTVRNSLVKPTYLPEVTTLDKALDHLRSTRTQLAVVVDEFGGTAGLITLDDIIEELVGDLDANGSGEIEAPRSIGPGQWIVDGNTSTSAWQSIIGPVLGTSAPATIGGLVTMRLGRSARVGDVVHVSNLRLEVHHVEEDRVTRVLLTLEDDVAGTGGDA